jgi:hypothetical protein
MYQRIDGRRPEEELYDVRNDPYQLHNLADNRGYAAIKQGLSDALTAELKRTKDPRIEGTYEEIFYIPHYENEKARRRPHSNSLTA